MKKLITLLGISFFMISMTFGQKSGESVEKATTKKQATLRDYSYVATNSKTQLQGKSTRVSGFLKESFEGTFPPNGWIKLNPDGGSGWAQLSAGTSPLPGWNGGTQTVPPGGGNKVAYCTYTTGGQTFNDQWLITPQFTVTAGDSLIFWLWWFGSYQDRLTVLISTTGNNASDFTDTILDVDTTDLMPMATWKRFAFDISNYAGQSIYVAFREFVSDNQDEGAFLALDLVQIGTPPTNDVSVEAIIFPSVTLPGNYTPKAIVANNGTATQTFDVKMTINGIYSSTQTVTNLAQGQTYEVSFDNWNANVGTYTIEVQTLLSGDEVPTNDTLSKIVTIKHLKKAYCYMAYDPSNNLTEGPAYFYLEDPTQITSLNDQSTMNYLTAGTWGAGNKWYAVVGTENKLVTLDTITGVRTEIGTIGISMAGISYDYKNNRLYGVNWDGANSNLYIISPINGKATKIGTCGDKLIINLACDTSGNLYGVSTTDDKLYKINSTNGTLTAIGNIGFDAQYAQDLEFDRATNTLYYAAYNNTASQGELRTVNTTNGSTTLVGVFQNKSEITGFAIPYYAQAPTIDLAVSSLIGPKDACGLSNETISVIIENLGSTDVTNVPITYKVNNGTPINETIPSISAGSAITYNFSTQYNFSNPGTYNITVTVALPTDQINGNNELTFTVKSLTPSNIPYTSNLDNNTGWTVEDVNNDNKTWTYSSTGGNTTPSCYKYSYNANLNANDWLFTPCINLQSGKTYNLTFAYKARSASYPEKIKVKIGTNPTYSAMTTQITDLPNIVNTSYQNSTTNFTVPTTGVYYIGFQCYSDADQWEVYVDDVSITQVSGIEENNINQIAIYPNPAKNSVYITAPYKLGKITIINSLGQNVYSVLSETETININTSTLKEGVYFVKIENENGSSINKLVITE